MHSNDYNPTPLKFNHRTPEEMDRRASEFQDLMIQRRTVRDFSDKPVSRKIIEHAIAVASSAPSGANMQPWHFVAVQDQAIKHKIRIAAEEEEKRLYEGRASQEWLDALAPFGTDANKPFLEIAPWLIAVFAQKHTIDSDGKKHKHYYTPESVGIATGMLVTALHYAGLATLTHTPSPMGFLRDILGRPLHEKPFLLLVTGFPTNNTTVPKIQKKSVEQYMTVF